MTQCLVNVFSVRKYLNVGTATSPGALPVTMAIPL